MRSDTILCRVFVGLLASLAGPVVLLAEPGPAASRAVDKADAEARRIAQDAEKVGKPFTGRLEERGSTAVDVPLEDASCYAFVAAGGPGVGELSLTVRAQGKEVASRRIAGDVLAVEWCSPGKTTAAVRLTLFQGSGDFALAVYRVNKGEARAGQGVGGAGNDFIANRIRQLHGQFGRGRKAASPVFKGNLDTGKEQLFEAGLEAGHCYTIIACGSPSVRGFDLYLIDRNGREILSSSRPASFAALDTDPCIGATGPYRVKIRMFSGYGQFGLQVFSD